MIITIIIYGLFTSAIEVMFLLPFVGVFLWILFVCEQDNSTSYGSNLMKFSLKVSLFPSYGWLDSCDQKSKFKVTEK